MELSVGPLAHRLRVLEGALPGGELPRAAFDSHARKPRPSRRLGVAAGLIAAMLISGAAGAAVHQVMTGVTGHPGVFSPEGALACSPIQHMNPAAADQALRALGYVVTWQIEYRAEDPDQNETATSSTPPIDGYIVNGEFDGDRLLLIVQRGPAAHPAPGCAAP